MFVLAHGGACHHPPRLTDPRRGVGPGAQIPDYSAVQTEMAAGQGFDGILGSSMTSQDPEMRKIREDLVALLPMVAEANAMSQELDKGITFDLFVRSGASHDLNDKEKRVRGAGAV